MLDIVSQFSFASFISSRHKLRYFVLVALLCTTKYGLAQECQVSSFTYIPPADDSDNITVKSESALLVKDQLAVFEGNVSIISPSSTITANSANILDNGKEIKASGDVQYTDELLQVNSEAVEVNSNLKLLQMQETDYKIAGINGRGGADLLSISQERGVTLEDVSFTTCPEGGEDWKIQASEISIEKGMPFGEAYNTRFILFALLCVSYYHRTPNRIFISRVWQFI
jgi:LPS-assembly protein